jgi:D-lactate dehydrogenase
MRVAVYSAKPYDVQYLTAANSGHELIFLEPRLSVETAPLAADADAVCAFVNDDLGEAVLEELAAVGVRHIALRSAGYNHVDLHAADRLGITVTRVPGYSPYAVAEHAVALLMTLVRKTHRAYNRVPHGKTVGVVGTGQIGTVFARIMTGFGCRVLAFDPYPNEECRQFGVQFVELEQLLAESHVVSLHLPLTPQTRHFIDADRIALMRDGVTLVNTSRGLLVDTVAVIEALKSGKIGLLGLDVYEEEADLFFDDLSDRVLRDDVFTRLLTIPNVVITGHQAFFTVEALQSIAETTIGNLTAAQRGDPLPNRVTLD